MSTSVFAVSAPAPREQISLISLIAAAALSLWALPAAALPSLTPHPNDAGKIWFEEDGVKDGNDDHNHLFPHSVQGSAGAGHVHDAFSVWDNRTYRYGVSGATIAGGILADFWHGFIAPGMEPRYKFIDGVGASKTFDATSKGLIAAAVAEWRAKAKAASAGKTTPDGTPLVTELNFVETAGMSFEFRIGFFDNLIEANGALAEWLVSDAQVVGLDADFAADELGTVPVLAFDDDIAWLFDTTMTPAGAQRDFATIALHEFGHVLGLLHAPGNPAGNLMRASIVLEAMNGATLRTVDTSSANGAAELYTQPVPEPAMIAIFGFGLILLGLGRRPRLAA